MQWIEFRRIEDRESERVRLFQYRYDGEMSLEVATVLIPLHADRAAPSRQRENLTFGPPLLPSSIAIASDEAERGVLLTLVLCRNSSCTMSPLVLSGTADELKSSRALKVCFSRFEIDPGSWTSALLPLYYVVSI